MYVRGSHTTSVVEQELLYWVISFYAADVRTMSVIFEHLLGWILDEQKFYNACYEYHGFHISSALYKIDEPFRMDSQVEAMNKRLQLGATCGESNEQHCRKRRKRSRSETCKFEDQVISDVKRDFDALIDAARKSTCFKERPDSSLLLTNNRCAREAEKMAEQKAAFPGVRRVVPSAGHNGASMVLLQCGGSYNVEKLARKTCDNPVGVPLVFSTGDQTYLMPSNSRFAWGDVGEELKRCMEEDSNARFDLVVIDPPWRNKTVKRQKTYATQDERDLEDLPIGHLLKPNALVAVWVTNNPQYYEYLIQTLLPCWGLDFEARWFWFKVTTSGEPVCQCRKGFKLPFESIVFARPRLTEERSTGLLPSGKLLVSVSSALPSRKPPLLDILRRCYFPGPFTCLELYARYLLPNTFSIGDQVIKFQCTEYFTRVNKDSE